MGSEHREHRPATPMKLHSPPPPLPLTTTTRRSLSTPEQSTPVSGHRLGALEVDGPDSAWRNRAPGPHRNTARQAMDGLWTEVCGRQKQSNDPGNNQHNPQYANYWAPLTHKRHIPPHPAQPRHTKPLGSGDAETTPARAPAAAADRTQRPDATCEGTNG